MATARFNFFRYQLLPRNRYHQGEIFGFKTVDELIKNKNKVFLEELTNIQEFHYNFAPLEHEIVIQNENIIVMKFHVKRTTRIWTRKGNKPQKIENWPIFWVIINNNPLVQMMAIQHRSEAFIGGSRKVAQFIHKTLSYYLSDRQLLIEMEPIFSKKQFWEYINLQDKKIEKISFELITPNMANISEMAAESLKTIAKGSNAESTNVTMLAPKTGSLRISEEEENVRGLVDYTSLGGGTITLKIRGIKKLFKSIDIRKEVTIDEIELSGEAENVVNVANKLFDRASND